MKTLQKLILILTVVGLTSCYSQRTQIIAQNDAQISFQTFYNELAPYGQWVEDYDYGYLWIPHVNRNFQPYASDGYWTMTNYGNTWVSDFSWGWAPFHYGRWIRDDFLGWAWIPGYEWAPAWVSWRSGGGQYGWAPMGPRMRVNVNINIPWSHWTFLPQKYMYGRNMHRYYNRGNRNYYNQTTIINNTNIYNNTYYSGPSARDVERSTGRRVSVRNVTNSGRSGRTSVNDRSVSMYRPEVTRNSGRTERPASAPNRSTTTNSGRTSGSSNRSTNVDRSSNRTSPQNTRNNDTVNNSNRTNSTNRVSSVNRSTQSQTEPTRNSSGTVNRSNATTNQNRTGSGTVNSRSTTTRQNSNSATKEAVNRSSTSTRQVATPTRSRTTNTKSNSNVSTSRSRVTSTQSATRSSSTTNTSKNSSTRSSSSRSGRGR